MENISVDKSFSEFILQYNTKQVCLFSVGQAGYIIKSSGGQLLCIDLYLSDCGARIENNLGFKRLMPRVLEPREIIFDAVIATHPHFDHFDPDSMSEMMSNDRSILFASVNCKELVRERSIDENRVKYVKPGDSVTLGDFEVFFVSCDHGTGAPDAFGVVVRVDGKTIYEVGDSCFRKDIAEEIVAAFDRIDVMMGPINGAFGNMNEHDYAVYTALINPKLAIPCHYGMFEAHGGNPELFSDIMNKEYPEQKFIILKQGERIEL